MTEALLDRNCFLLKCSPRVSGKAQAPRTDKLLRTDRAGSSWGRPREIWEAEAGPARTACSGGRWFPRSWVPVVRNPEALVGDSGGGRAFLEHGSEEIGPPSLPRVCAGGRIGEASGWGPGVGPARLGTQVAGLCFRP